MGASAQKMVVNCDPCQDRKATSFCTECREFYCTECSSLHKTLTVTRKHTQVYISTGDQNPKTTVNCDQCRISNKTQSATSVCVECRELFCNKCSTYHGKIKATRYHMIFQFSGHNRTESSGAFQQLLISSPKPDFSFAQEPKHKVVDKSPSNIKVKSLDVSDTSLKDKLGGETDTSLNAELGGVTDTSLKAELGSVTNTSLKDELGGVTDTSLKAELGGVTDTSLKAKLGGVTDTSLKAELGGVTNTSLKAELGGVTDTSLKAKLGDGKDTCTSLKDKLGDVTDTSLKDKLNDVTYTSLKAELGDETDTSLKDRLDDVTDTSLKDKLDDVTDTSLKDKLGDVIDTSLKAELGDVTDTSLKVTYCKGFSTRIHSDTKEGSWEVNRMLTLQDDRVVVLDKENFKVKLFSADYKIMHHCDVDKYSTGLTSVDETTVAVSRGNTITLYTVHTDRLQKFRSITHGRIHVDMYDICSKDNKFGCLTYHEYNKWCIDVVDMEGHSKTIFTGNSLLYPFNSIITGDDSCFYVNTSHGEMRCVTLDGKQLWIEPLTFSGMILVRGRLWVVRNGDVRQISRDGKLLDEPVLQGLHTPYCICYQQKRNRILVSSFKPGSPIKVYQVL